jgi:hypothetical protein
MAGNNKIYSFGQETPYTLAYHLRKSSSLSIQGKLRTIVSYVPDKYGCFVLYTKRKVWFYRDGKRMMQVFIKKHYLGLRVRTKTGWVETEILESEDFMRLTFYLMYLEDKTDDKL